MFYFVTCSMKQQLEKIWQLLCKLICVNYWLEIWVFALQIFALTCKSSCISGLICLCVLFTGFTSLLAPASLWLFALRVCACVFCPGWTPLPRSVTTTVSVTLGCNLLSYMDSLVLGFIFHLYRIIFYLCFHSKYSSRMAWMFENINIFFAKKTQNSNMSCL